MSSTCATVGSSCSSTSSNPSEGLLISSLIFLGPCDETEVCNTIDRTRTVWLNYGEMEQRNAGMSSNVILSRGLVTDNYIEK